MYKTQRRHACRKQIGNVTQCLKFTFTWNPAEMYWEINGSLREIYTGWRARLRSRQEPRQLRGCRAVSSRHSFWE